MMKVGGIVPPKVDIDCPLIGITSVVIVIILNVKYVHYCRVDILHIAAFRG